MRIINVVHVIQNGAIKALVPAKLSIIATLNKGNDSNVVIRFAMVVLIDLSCKTDENYTLTPAQVVGVAPHPACFTKREGIVTQIDASCLPKVCRKLPCFAMELGHTDVVLLASIPAHIVDRYHVVVTSNSKVVISLVTVLQEQHLIFPAAEEGAKRVAPPPFIVLTMAIKSGCVEIKTTVADSIDGKVICLGGVSIDLLTPPTEVTQKSEEDTIRLMKVMVIKIEGTPIRISFQRHTFQAFAVTFSITKEDGYADGIAITVMGNGYEADFRISKVAQIAES